MTNMTPEEIRRYSQARYEAIREVEATTAEKQAGAVVEVFRAVYELAAQVAELNIRFHNGFIVEKSATDETPPPPSAGERPGEKWRK